ncbi:putative Asparagine synthase (glutamine-hydrolyzing) [Candidatus Zixiibacteriota bacterium]|nr:putative Asparagine synthase (glutamine-hydrolyzing) [candidate division Zixibacteria bacterium]
MPGIFGVIRKQNEDRDANEKLIQEMKNRLSYNEQFTSQTYSGAWFAFGLVELPLEGEERLAIDERRQMASAFSGYIYDWKNVQSGQISAPTDKKATRLIDIYRASPDNWPEKIDGSFNAVIFDLEHKRVTIGNDRFGHRHLYIFEDDRYFLFATEVKAFLAYENFKKALNNNAVADYFNYGYLMGDKTMFSGARKLPGASLLNYQNGQISVRQYWDYHYGEESRQPIPEMIEEVDALYGQIIRKRIGQARNIILPLSGGLDSRFILHHTLLAGHNPRTFTHGIKGCLDYKVAKDVARFLKLEHFRFIEIDPRWIAQYSEQMIFLSDGMMDNSPAILIGIGKQYGLPAESSVFLNGIFGGPTNFGSSYFKPSEIVKDISHEEKLNRIKFTLGGDFLDDDFFFCFTDQFRQFLKDRYLPSIDDEFRACEKVSPWYCNQKDIFFIKNRLARYMNQVDCNRFFWHDHFALADDRLVDFYLKLPAHLKPGRVFMRDYFLAKLPDLARITYQGTGVNLYQTRSNFSKKYEAWRGKMRHYLERLSAGKLILYNKKNYHHYNQWYRACPEVRDFYESVLLDERTRRRGYYNMPHLEMLLKKQRRGAPGAGNLSSLLGFELFNRLFVD